MLIDTSHLSFRYKIYNRSARRRDVVVKLDSRLSWHISFTISNSIWHHLIKTCDWDLLYSWLLSLSFQMLHHTVISTKFTVSKAAVYCKIHSKMGHGLKFREAEWQNIHSYVHSTEPREAAKSWEINVFVCRRRDRRQNDDTLGLLLLTSEGCEVPVHCDLQFTNDKDVRYYLLLNIKLREWAELFVSKPPFYIQFRVAMAELRWLNCNSIRYLITNCNAKGGYNLSNRHS